MVESNFTIPTWTNLLRAKTTYENSTTENNLEALAVAVDSLQDKTMPYCVSANLLSSLAGISDGTTKDYIPFIKLLQQIWKPIPLIHTE